MRCEHFDREGLLRQETGRPDPHVDGCADCQAARATYRRMTEALADVGADLRPREGWEDAVLARARGERARTRRWLGAGVGGALLVAAAVMLWMRQREEPALVASIERVPSGSTVRAGDAEWAAGDHIWAISERGGAVWIYRDGRLELSCSLATLAPPHCMRHGDGVRAWHSTRLGTYHVFAFVAPPPPVAPATYDEARVLVSRGDGLATELPITVR